jgi:hypothetical protein
MKVKSTIKESALITWTKTIATIRVQAQESYHRLLSLDKRTQFAHEYLFSWAWYVSQTYPPPEERVRQLNTISWFIWTGDIYPVPLWTLYRPKEDGGWGMTNFAAKSHSLLLYRMRQHLIKNTMTAAWMLSWNLEVKSTNPLQRCNTSQHRIPAAFCPGGCPYRQTRTYRIYAHLSEKNLYDYAHPQQRVNKHTRDAHKKDYGPTLTGIH